MSKVPDAASFKGLSRTSNFNTQRVQGTVSLKHGKSSERVFNPKTGNWEVLSISKANEIELDQNTTSNDSQTVSESQTSADREETEIEYRTLEGDCELLPSTMTMKLETGKTVNVDGLGNNLTGKYYISNIKRTIDSNGYSQSINLIKTGFGDSVLSSTPEEAPKVPTLSFNSGDTVKIVGEGAIYSNASEGVKVPLWVKNKTLTITKLNSDSTKALLSPINSWTYTRFLQKV